MHVVLHVGAHRTASTAFQSHLAGNRATLEAAGCAYWGPRVTRGGLFRRLSGGRDAILPWERDRAAGRVAQRVAKLERDGVSQLVVSDENMLGSLRATLEGTRLYPEAGRRIAAFATGFAGHRLTVALGIRDYACWWTSALAFRLPRGGVLPRDPVRECMVTQPRRWRHLVQEIARALPDARVVVWTCEALAGDPARILQDLVEIETTPGLLPARNARPGAADLRACLQAIGVDAAGFRWEDGEFRPFVPYETEALAAQYAEDLAWLAAGAGGLADFIDAPPAQTGARTDEGRGCSDDPRHRRLAQAGRTGIARPSG